MKEYAVTKSQDSESQVAALLVSWASATRQNRTEDILRNHSADAVIFDVLAPMKYEGTEAYRRSWGDWQPHIRGEGVFQLENLVVSAGAEIAFAHCFIRCGGMFENGKSFEDLVRATFCLEKIAGSWRVIHQHISKPIASN
jgi:ketosteroid isomerase-like protein